MAAILSGVASYGGEERIEIDTPKAPLHAAEVKGGALSLELEPASLTVLDPKP